MVETSGYLDYTARECSWSLRVVAVSLLFLIGGTAAAGDVAPSGILEGPLEVACDGELPAIVLIAEVTIPGLFNRREYRFPLKRKSAPSVDGPIQSCVGGFSENGDDVDPTGGVATYYGASAYLDRIRSTAARLDLSFYWKTATGKGEFERKLSVPLFEPKVFEFRNGIVVRTHRGK
jgi:hypothetical protein